MTKSDEFFLADGLVEKGFGPFFGTPCGILAPLFSELERRGILCTVPREDSAVGIAAGASMAGGYSVVLMQNSGLGQSVNALASLVAPYRIPILFIVSLRGEDPDPTPENTVMGEISASLLEACGIAVQRLGTKQLAQHVEWAYDVVRHQRRSAALLVPPTYFGWQA